MYLGGFPIFIALIGFLLKLSHPLKQSKLMTSGYRWPWSRDGKILPAPIANQIAGNLGYRPLARARKFFLFWAKQEGHSVWQIANGQKCWCDVSWFASWSKQTWPRQEFRLQIIGYNFSSLSWLESVGRKTIFLFYFVSASPSNSAAYTLFWFAATEPQNDFTLFRLININIWKAPNG